MIDILISIAHGLLTAAIGLVGLFILTLISTRPFGGGGGVRRPLTDPGEPMPQRKRLFARKDSTR